MIGSHHGILTSVVSACAFNVPLIVMTVATLAADL